MPEVANYNFNYKEVVEALIKFVGLHEGIWQLSPQLGMNVSNLGPDFNNLKPTIVIRIENIALLKVHQETI